MVHSMIRKTQVCLLSIKKEGKEGKEGRKGGREEGRKGGREEKGKYNLSSA